MAARYWFVVSVLLVAGVCVAGCSSSTPTQLTPEQLRKQQEENKINLAAEDKAESEFQKKKR